MNPNPNSISRASPDGPGLPLPRVRMAAYVTLAFITAALGTLAVPVLGAERVDPVRLVIQLWEGGRGMFPIVILHAIGPVAIAVLGAALVRGRRVPAAPAALLGAIAFLPATIGLLAAAYANRQVGQNLGAEFASSAARGTSDLSNLFVYGDLVSAACGAVVVVVTCGAVGAIDLERLAPHRAGFAKSGWLAVPVAGMVWVLAYVVSIVMVGRGRTLSLLALTPALWIAFATVLAALAARAAGGLRACDDEDEARRHVSMLLVAGALGVAVPCFLERAVVGREEMSTFGAIGGDSLVYPSHRIDLLEELVPSWIFADRAVLIHAVLGTAMFALALAPAMGRGSRGRMIHPFVRSIAFPAAAVALLGLAAALFFSQRNALLRLNAPYQVSGTPPGITLPAVKGVADESDTPRSRSRSDSEYITLGTRVVISADGHIEIHGPPDGEARAFRVFADEAAPALLLVKLGQYGQHASDPPDSPRPVVPEESIGVVTLVGRAFGYRKPDASRVGPYASFADFGSEHRFLNAIVPAKVPGKFWPLAPGPVLSASIVSRDALRILMPDGAAPVVASFVYGKEGYEGLPPLQGTKIAGISLEISRTTNVGDVITAVAALSSTYRHSLVDDARSNDAIALWFDDRF